MVSRIAARKQARNSKKASRKGIQVADKPKGTNKPTKFTRRKDEDYLDVFDDTEIDTDKRRNRDLDDVDNYEYHQQEIDSEDDEEIDEDEAFNDSDDEKYGAFFEDKQVSKATSSKSKKKNVTGEISLNEEESEEEDDQDDSEEEDELEDNGEYMDLSAMLDEQDQEPVPKTNSLTSASLFPHSDDEDDFDDEVMNIDDDEDDDDDAEEAQSNGNLLSFVSSLDPSQKKRKRIEEVTEAAEQSEFGLGPKLYSSESSSAKRIALSDLISTVEDEAGFAAIKKQVNRISTDDEKVKVASAPLPKNIQDKYNRQAAYEETSKDVSKWVPIVKKNREAETLSFPMNEAPIERVTSGSLVSKFEPITDLEKEIESLLETSGLNERKQKELEELELNTVSKKELRERQRELASMRNLLFYQELKQKKIAKIKSKTYRKIHKKDAEKKKLDNLKELKDLDPEYVQAELERMETDRARERMTLKHKNTGKWAKQLLGRKDLDENSRQALQEQLQRHEELRRKISGLDSDEESDASTNNGPIEEESDEEQDEIEAARKQLSKMADDVERDSEETPTTGLFAMKFMQKAVQAQKEKAKRDIERARQELDGELVDVDEESHDDMVKNGRQNFAVNPKAIKTSAGRDSDEYFASDKEEFTLQVSGPVSVVPKDLQKPLFPMPTFTVKEVEEEVFVGNVNTKPLPSVNIDLDAPKEKSEKLSSQGSTKFVSLVTSLKEKTLSNKPQSSSASSLEEEESESDMENPWLAGLNDSAPKARKQKVLKKGKDTGFNKNAPNLSDSKLNKDSKKAKGRTNIWESKEILLEGLEEIEQAGETKPSVEERKIEVSPPTKRSAPLPADDDSDCDSDIDEAMVNQLDIKKMSGLEVLKMAFENDNVIEEFEKEKEDIIQRDAPKEEDVTLPGWGSWSGAGIQPQMNRVVVKSKDGISAEKRKDAKLKHVILNEKRMKTATKYMLPQLPHNFETREQYERSIRMPLGKEWNSQRVHAKMVQPKVQKRLGAIIKPLRFQSSKKN